MNSDINQRQGNASIYDETAGNYVVVKSSKNAGVFEGMNPISKTATKKNIDSMTPEERQAITNYTSEYNAGNSDEVNRYLRLGEGSEASKKAAELLTSALDKCKLGTNTVLFRGVEPSIFGADAEKAIKKLNRAVKNRYTKNFDSSLNKLSSLEGTIIQDKGCMSTSTVFDRKYTGLGVIMRIQASKNDKACDIYDLSRYGGNRDAFSKMFGYSYETAENEVLFAPNSKLKIIGTTVTSDGVVLDCKTI
ncbi:MAG: hypothetical protein IJ122_06105 [Methanobrevibacter sp.]|nr:hypothetical protein [Methanobrevibacter sp.]